MNDFYNEHLKEDLRVVAEDIEQLLDDVGHTAGEQNEKLRRRLHAVRERLARLEHRATERLRKVSARSNRYVHEKPWGVVGAAAGMAFLLGMLSTRSHH